MLAFAVIIDARPTVHFLSGSRWRCGETGGRSAGFVTGTAPRGGAFWAQNSVEHPRRAVGFASLGDAPRKILTSKCARLLASEFEVEINERTYFERRVLSANVNEIQHWFPQGMVRENRHQDILEDWILKELLR